MNTEKVNKDRNEADASKVKDNRCESFISTLNISSEYETELLGKTLTEFDWEQSDFCYCIEIDNKDNDWIFENFKLSKPHSNILAFKEFSEGNSFVVLIKIVRYIEVLTHSTQIETKGLLQKSVWFNSRSILKNEFEGCPNKIRFWFFYLTWQIESLY